ncbi:CHAP domain-containing protein, partial [Glaesserella parasuis]|uniref:CHAP domain-containing protein n=1 Tax=Glaesserella parasuis TaxID=738 RepID=UPI003F2F56A2
NVERAKAGDLIIFNWNGDAWPDHVGFVKSITNGIITTVEGNYRKTVGNRNIAMNSPFIVGIIQL